LGISPAELTWRKGVDILSLGATKNGALAAEAVIFFNPAQAHDFAARRKRGGQLLSKLRFMSAQIEAWLTDEFWLRAARHANGAAAKLARGLEGLPGTALWHPVEANEIFIEFPEETIQRLLARGHLFYRWQGSCVRLVTGFDTPLDEIDDFLRDAAGG
jgi:threonine aldolase